MQHFLSFINDLNSLIKVPSVKGEKTESAPFGENIERAFSVYKSIAERLGFTVINHNGYALEVAIGDGEEIGIIGHLDVVPSGTGWETDPFTLTEKDGIYYGRGLCDDKAPMLICLYALKQLKDSGIPFNRKIRLIVGGDEESSWQDAKYLKENANLPVYGFSPDGNFPVSYAEKGMAVIKIKIPKLKNFTDIKGGTVVNAVCGYASAKPNFVVNEKELKEFGLTFNNGIIESVGKSAHGSQQQLGKNALLPLFKYFLSKGEKVEKVLDYLFYDKVGLCKLNSEEGFITLSPDIIYESENEIELLCDCRFPHPFTLDTVKEKLNQFGLDYEISLKHDTLFVEKDSPLVRALLSAYNSVLGTNGKPISQGGSTFARVFEKGVAFGPEFVGKSNFIHEPNERISKEDLIKLYDIYYTAILNLIK